MQYIAFKFKPLSQFLAIPASLNSLSYFLWRIETVFFFCWVDQYLHICPLILRIVLLVPKLLLYFFKTFLDIVDISCFDELKNNIQLGFRPKFEGLIKFDLLVSAFDEIVFIEWLILERYIVWVNHLLQ